MRGNNDSSDSKLRNCTGDELNLIEVRWMWMQRMAVNNSIFENESDIGEAVSDWTKNYNKTHSNTTSHILHKILISVNIALKSEYEKKMSRLENYEGFIPDTTREENAIQYRMHEKLKESKRLSNYLKELDALWIKYNSTAGCI